MIPRICLFLLTLCLAALAPAQDTLRVQGRVFGSAGSAALEPLVGARVGWSQGPATVTDLDGAFSLPFPAAWPATLITSGLGATTDTLLLTGPPSAPLRIELGSSIELREAQVVERQQSTLLSTRSLQAMETLGTKELKRAACCDLSESFETNATVDVNFSDAISGTKTIRMLGLDGKYAQISVENIPFIRGLSSSYGLTLIPARGSAAST
ncbi:MAG: hypothetical protein QM724_05225 [Flavobacteriales bacterium]